MRTLSITKTKKDTKNCDIRQKKTETKTKRNFYGSINKKGTLQNPLRT